jgi:hypothetical protein
MIVAKVLNVVSIFVDNGSNNHLNITTYVIVNLNLVFNRVILSIPKGLAFNHRDGGELKRMFGPQSLHAIVNRLLCNLVNCGTSDS